MSRQDLTRTEEYRAEKDPKKHKLIYLRQKRKGLVLEIQATEVHLDYTKERLKKLDEEVENELE